MRRTIVLVLLALILYGSGWCASSPSASSENEKAAAKGTTAFALALYQQLRKSEHGNLFFSPASMAAALALVDAGAAGQTAKELDQLLQTGLAHQESHRAVAALLKRYQSARGEASLELANRIWAKQGVTFRPDYLAGVQDEFGAAVEHANFEQAAAKATINGWVAQQTRNKITELIQDLDPRAELVLVNAIYFYGMWKVPFDAAQTADAPFTLGSGEQVHVPMMHRRESVRAAEVDGVQVLELPYGNAGTLAFDLFLPAKKDGLGAFEDAFNAEALSRMLGALDSAKVHLALPRFAQRSRFDLASTLVKMGAISLLVAPDFSAMSDSGGLLVSAVLHEAVVEVNEKGTEASAATAVTLSRGMQQEPELNITANHPFLFLIRDTASGGVLFIGRVADPRK